MVTLKCAENIQLQKEILIFTPVSHYPGNINDLCGQQQIFSFSRRPPYLSQGPGCWGMPKTLNRLFTELDWLFSRQKRT